MTEVEPKVGKLSKVWENLKTHFTKAVHNPVQQMHTTECTGQKRSSPVQKKSPVVPGPAATCGVVQLHRVEDRGLEPLTFWLPARRSPN